MNVETFRSLEAARDYFQEKYDAAGFDNFSKSDVIPDSIKVIETDNNILISCLKHDSEVENPIEDYGDGEFKVFRNQDTRDQFIDSLKKKLFYLVDKYEHGNSHYSISGTKSYPDDLWDVSHGCAVFVPDSDIQSEYKKLLKTEDMTPGLAKEKFIKNINSSLDNYSDWCNGETFYHMTNIYDKKGEFIDDDSSGGYIGYDYAEKEQIYRLKDEAQDLVANELMEKVEIITSTNPKDVGFKIDKKDLVSLKIAKVYDETIVAASYSIEDKAIMYKQKNNEVTLHKFKKIPGYEHYHVTTEKFLDACMTSDICSAIKSHLDEASEMKAKKPSMK